MAGLKWLPVAILVLSLCLRWAVLALIWSTDPLRVVATDTASYEDTARALLEIGRFAVSPERPDAPQTIRTPGYPAFIAAIYALSAMIERPDGGRALVIAAQGLIGVSTMALVFAMGRRLWGWRAAFIALVLLTLDMDSFTLTERMLTETLFTLVLAGAAMLGVRLLAADRGRPANRGRPADKGRPAEKAGAWQAFGLGTALAAMALIRPIAYYLVFPVLVGLLILGLIARWTRQRHLAVLLSILLPWIVLVGGWQLRNYVTTGSWEFSHIRGVNLLAYRGADIVARRDGISLAEARKRLQAELLDRTGTNVEAGRTDDVQRTQAVRPEALYDLYASEGMALIKQHPLLAIKGQARGLLKLLFVPGENAFLSLLGRPARASGPIGDLYRLSAADYVQVWLVDERLAFALFAGGLFYLLTVYLGAAFAVWDIAWDYVRRRTGRLAAHAYLIGIILYMLLLSAGPEAYSRFRVPVMPLLALYAGAGLDTLLCRAERGSF